MQYHKRSAVIIIKDEKILLIHRIKNDNEYYAFPGGTIEKNEKSEETAIREIKEETNLDIVLDKLLWEYKDEHHYGYYFLAKTFEGKIKLGWPETGRNNPNNQYNLEWIKLDNLDNILLYPEEIAKRIKQTFNK
ncbi:NUDIX domain-containing protein [Patescibacteria group bacterium]|nr:NUDIX domain-containing protein [Patescibacteria group bacterium]